MNSDPVRHRLANDEIADLLNQYGTLAQLDGQDSFRVRAYENAARAVSSHQSSMADLVENGFDLTKISGIGKAIAEKIRESLQHGSFHQLEEMQERIPPGLVELAGIRGLGAKRVRQLRDALGIETLYDLEQHARAGDVRNVEGFGKKREENILAAIEYHKEQSGRRLRVSTESAAGRVVDAIRNIDGVMDVKVAGSFRRWLETVKDLDIIVITETDDVLKRVLESDIVTSVESSGEKKASVSLGGLPADIRVFSPAELPTALHHFTGSKAHHERLRSMAKKKGLKISEYGVFTADGEPLAVDTEADIYRHLDMPFIIPEMREGLFEFSEDILSEDDYITVDDIAGIFHVHTDRSDGRETLEAMVEGARQRGFAYLGIADHSRSAGYAGGLSMDELKEQMDEIAAINERYDDITVFSGIESDILADGSLDYPDELLMQLDFVVGSIHSRFTMEEKEMTERILGAVHHPALTMLGHMTGRLLLARKEYALDADAVIEGCAKSGTIIELNANPQRLDIDWRLIPKAAAAGAMFAINPDAHATGGYDDIRHGVHAARKAGLTPASVLNTRSTEKVRTLLRAVRSGKG